MYVNHSSHPFTVCNKTLIARTPIKAQWTPLLLNKRIKFCLYLEHAVCIRLHSRADKRDSVGESHLSLFFVSISISVGAPVWVDLCEWGPFFSFLCFQGQQGQEFHPSPSLGYRSHVSYRWSPPPHLTSPLDILICLRHDVSCFSVTVNKLNKKKNKD